MKVTVVGAGNVGATCANVLAYREIANEVVLVDIKEGLAESKKNKATGEDHGGYQFKLEFDNCGVTEVKCDKIEAFHDSDTKFQDDDVSK